MKQVNTYNHQQTGSILLMALVFLALTSMIAMTIMDTSILENRMAANQQFKEEAVQHTEGIVRNIMANYDDASNPTLPISIPYGSLYCEVGDNDPLCEENSLYVAGKLLNAIPSDVNVLYRGRRLHSQKVTASSEDTASSGQTFHFIEMFAEYEGMHVGLSNARLAVGVKISQFAPGSQQFVDTEEGGWGLY